ncbi:class I SAM-dependent methyltransferase [Rhizobium mongolense]|uniref:class I SAM-dependent methyltransferase n=1 Tax=Rhizobium mongolense TaxID=57676 RepID=UPI003556D79B
MGRWSRRLATPFLEFAGVPSRGRVLDAGCGTGSLALALAAHPELEAIGALDFEESFVAALEWRVTDIRIEARQGDVCALPYENETFDGVYSLLVLHFVSDAHRAVQEMRRVLRPVLPPQLQFGPGAACRVGDCFGMSFLQLSQKRPGTECPRPGGR